MSTENQKPNLSIDALNKLYAKDCITEEQEAMLEMIDQTRSDILNGSTAALLIFSVSKNQDLIVNYFFNRLSRLECYGAVSWIKVRVEEIINGWAIEDTEYEEEE